MTRKQKLFADLYILYGNATRAAKEAGYSHKSADRTGHDNLKKHEIKSYIDTEMKAKDKKIIADADEVLKFLTDTMRGNYKEETIVIEATGDYCSAARIMKKEIQPKDKLNAAELLGKRYQIFTEKIKISDDKDIYTKEEIDEANKKMIEELEDD